MSKVDWSQLKTLKENMNWGDASKMDSTLLYTIDSWSIIEKKQIFVTPNGGTTGEHSPNSLHYSGRAIDFVIPSAQKEDLFSMFISLLRFPFTEIGIYPDWRYNGKQVGGFHAGLDSGNLLVRKKLWMGVRDTNRKNIYIGITKANLIAYKLI